MLYTYPHFGLFTRPSSLIFTKLHDNYFSHKGCKAHSKILCLFGELRNNLTPKVCINKFYTLIRIFFSIYTSLLCIWFSKAHVLNDQLVKFIKFFFIIP